MIDSSDLAIGHPQQPSRESEDGYRGMSKESGYHRSGGRGGQEMRAARRK